MTANRFQADGPADHVACQLTSDGTVSGAPRAWLRAEAVVLLAGALAAYSTTGQPWWLVPAVILLPDLAWAGDISAGHASGPSSITRRTPHPCQL